MKLADIIKKFSQATSKPEASPAGDNTDVSNKNYDAYEIYSIFHEQTEEKTKLIDEETFLKIQNGEIETDDELVINVINAAKSDDDKAALSYDELGELCEYFENELTKKIDSVQGLEKYYRKDIDDVAKYYLGKSAKRCSNEELNKAYMLKLIDSIAKDVNAFGENNGYTLDDSKKSTNMDYGVITPNNMDPNKPAPVIVYLHGSGGNKRSLYNQIMDDYNLDQGFTGYIICPSLNRSKWDSDAVAQDIDEILNTFSQTHNIDANNIVIAGHSLGGTGALYMADSEIFKDDEGYKFSRAAAMTGYPEKKHTDKYDIPVGLWVDSGSEYLLNHNVVPSLDLNGEDKYVDLVGKAHTQIDNIAFTQDTDNNGRADLIEWLFNEEEN